MADTYLYGLGRRKSASTSVHTSWQGTITINGKPAADLDGSKPY